MPLEPDAYFVNRNGKQHGPFTLKKVLAGVRMGDFEPYDMVRLGDGPWFPISQLKKPDKEKRKNHELNQNQPDARTPFWKPKWLAGILCAFLIFGSLAGYYFFSQVKNQLESINLDKLKDASTPLDRIEKSIEGFFANLNAIDNDQVSGKKTTVEKLITQVNEIINDGELPEISIDSTASDFLEKADVQSAQFFFQNPFKSDEPTKHLKRKRDPISQEITIQFRYQIKRKNDASKQAPIHFLAVNGNDTAIGKCVVESRPDPDNPSHLICKSQLRFPSVREFGAIHSFIIEQIPEPTLEIFQTKLRASLLGGDAKSIEALMTTYSPRWKKRFYDICHKFAVSKSAPSRAATAIAVSFAYENQPDDEQLFFKLMNDQDPTVVKAVIDSVIRIKNPNIQMVESLFSHAEARADQSRESALSSISKNTPRTKEMISLFLSKAYSIDEGVRSSVANSLATADLDAEDAFKLGKSLLAENDKANRANGFKILLKSKEKKRQEALIEIFENTVNQDPAIATQAKAAIETLLPPRKDDFEVLVRLIESNNPKIKVEASEWLAKADFGTEESIIRFGRLVDSKISEVRIAGLNGLSQKPNGIKSEIKRVKSCLLDHDPNVRKVAYEVIAKNCRQTETLKELIDGLADNDPNNAKLVESLLRNLKPRINKEDFLVLDPQINSTSLNVRQFVFRSLSENSKDAKDFGAKVASAFQSDDKELRLSALKVMTDSKYFDSLTLGKVAEWGEKFAVSADVKIKPRDRLFTFEDVVEKVSPSVCVVELGGGWGSGFLVAPKLVATNKHVGKRVGNKVQIYFPAAKGINNFSIPGKTIWVHNVSDLALIEIANDFGLKPIPLRPETQIKPGQDVMSIGSPAAGKGAGGIKMENFVRKGVFSGLKEDPEEGTMAQIDIQGNPGNSGGPILDQTGHAFALVTKGIELQRFSWCAPVSPFISVLPKNNNNAVPREIPKEFDVNKPEAQSDDELISYACLEYIGSLGPNGAGVLDHLRRIILQSRSEYIKGKAIEAIGKIGTQASVLIPDLVKEFVSVQDGDLILNKFRREFFEAGNNLLLVIALSEMGENGAKVLSKSLYDKNNPTARFGALLAFERMGTSAKSALPDIYYISLKINEKNPLIVALAQDIYARLEKQLKK